MIVDTHRHVADRGYEPAETRSRQIDRYDVERASLVHVAPAGLTAAAALRCGADRMVRQSDVARSPQPYAEALLAATAERLFAR